VLSVSKPRTRPSPARRARTRGRRDRPTRGERAAHDRQEERQGATQRSRSVREPVREVAGAARAASRHPQTISHLLAKAGVQHPATQHPPPHHKQQDADCETQPREGVDDHGACQGQQKTGATEEHADPGGHPRRRPPDTGRGTPAARRSRTGSPPSPCPRRRRSPVGACSRPRRPTSLRRRRRPLHRR